LGKVEESYRYRSKVGAKDDLLSKQALELNSLIMCAKINDRTCCYCAYADTFSRADFGLDQNADNYLEYKLINQKHLGDTLICDGQSNSCIG
jgi:hypothetical protein